MEDEINVIISESEDVINFNIEDSIGVWGDIIGTLSNQTDLQNALNLKYDASDFNTDFDTRFSTKDTDDLTEGSINLYDKTVSITGGTNVTIGGTYPNFTITDNSASSSDLITHTSNSSIHFEQSEISITASQVSDFDTEVSNNSDVSANTTHRSSNGTDHTYIDQDVTSSSSPSFNDIKIAGKVYLDFASDSYLQYNPTTQEVELYRGGQIRASW